MKTVRWGILSVSRHYELRVHTPVTKLAGIEMAAIASRDRQKATAAAQRLGIARAYGSYEELLSDPAIDAVYIPLPNSLHAHWTIAALEAGKHVLCEKPFAMNAAETTTMLAKAKSTGKLLMEAFMYRFHPQWQRIKEIVVSGEIGEVRCMHCWFSYFNSDPANIRNQLDVGGGALFDIGCYAVSSARFLVGREPVRVCAHIERDPTFGTDWLTSAMLDFGQGCHVSFHVSTLAHSYQKVDVLGSRGAISVEIPFNSYPDSPMKVQVTTHVGSRTLFLGPADQYGLLFDAFSQAVREGATVAPTGAEDGRANMLAIDALFKSEKTGTWQNVLK